ncbi:macro domain-containing protein [Nocardia gipuzkoensis]
MTEIQYKTGDATTPDLQSPTIIAHICNDIGRWGKGFVLAVSARWPQPEQAYRDWHRHRAQNDFGLGAIQLVHVEPNLHVANMIGQHGIRPTADNPPIRYTAVDQCLTALAHAATAHNASVAMPRIGCGLAGGTWDKIEPLILNRLCQQGVRVTVYDLE